MTRADFIASLPDALDLEGDGKVSDVPAAIKRDIKLAVAAGLIPKDAKFSVTRNGGKSFFVRLVNWRGQALHPLYLEAILEAWSASAARASVCPGSFPTGGDGQNVELLSGEWNMHANKARDEQASRRASQDVRLSDEVNEVMSLVEYIADRHNYSRTLDGGNFVQYGYYLTVNAYIVISAAERGVRMEVDPLYRELHDKALKAADRLGTNAVRSICGAGGVDQCSQSALEKLVQLDAKAQGRPVKYDRHQNKWSILMRATRATGEAR